MRVLPDKSDFVKWLLDMGKGSSGSQVEIPRKFVAESEEMLIENVFGKSLGPHGTDQLFTRCILTIGNKTVRMINSAILEQFEGRQISYYSKDSVGTDGFQTPYNDINDEVLNSLNPSGLSAHSITL